MGLRRLTSLRNEVRRPIVRRRRDVLEGEGVASYGKFEDRFRRREVSTQPITGAETEEGHALRYT